MSKLNGLAMVMVVLGVMLGAAGSAGAVRLAAQGRAEHPVVVSERAAPATRELAQTLAQYLEKISGAKFEVVVGDGLGGIAVGTAADWPALEPAAGLASVDITQMERYRLRSHDRGLYVLGAGELAVQHAVWDLLYRLGHRQFFPTDKWEIVPHTPELSIDVDALEQPDYQTRVLFGSYGLWPFAESLRQKWNHRNRLGGAMRLNTGHVYDLILRRNREAFEQHPEYLALVKGERKAPKFCISNPGLRELVKQWALKEFTRLPDIQCISMDPSDGDGWCECEQCAAIGAPSDLAVTLANEVVAAINASGEQRFVGMYAYNRHSPPPSIAVDPRVIVSVATQFQKDGATTEQIIDGWRARGTQRIGIREYHSFVTWNHDLPGRGLGANLPKLARTIPDFHRRGVRFYTSESDDNWGVHGLGLYLTARMLWDIREADRIDALVDDFLDRCFGSAREPMAQFYHLLGDSSSTLLSDDLIGRMYRLLQDARGLTDDPQVLARLDDLTLYTRFVDLYTRFDIAKPNERQAAFEQLARHLFRIRPSMMVHTKAELRDLPARDKQLIVPPEAQWNAIEGANPWLSTEPWSREELVALTDKGIAEHPLLAFKPVAFSDELVPAAPLHLPPDGDGGFGGRTRGRVNWYTWIDKAPKPIELRATGGLIPQYRDRGDAKFTLYQVHHATGDAASQGATTPDGVERTIQLTAHDPGLHRLEVSDGNDATSMTWPAGLPMTRKAAGDEPLSVIYGRGSLCFYVPRGTKVIGGHLQGFGSFTDSRGQVHAAWTKENPNHAYFHFPVPAGQDGKLWRIEGLFGTLRLMTVPPFLARNGGELLLPVEVVNSDAKRR
jgi:hypothetical protein